MIVEYILYVFIGLGFLAGIVRGWKKELCVLIALVVSLLAVLFTFDIIKDIVNGFFSVAQIFDIAIVKTILSYITIRQETLEFIAFGAVPFVLLFALITHALNAIIFSPKKIIAGKGYEGNKLLGGLIGIASGVLAGIFFVLLFSSSSVALDYESGVISKILFNMPFIKSVLTSIGAIL